MRTLKQIVRAQMNQHNREQRRLTMYNDTEQRALKDEVLTAEELHKVLDYNYSSGVFFWKEDRGTRARSGDIAGSMAQNGNVSIKIGKFVYLAHRLAWLYQYGVWPPKDIDLVHLNRNNSDNRIVNLALRVRQLNGTMKYINEPPKDCRRYLAKVKNKELGWFDTEEEAKQAERLYIIGPSCGYPASVYGYDLGRFDTEEEAKEAEEAYKELL